jgi:hypothetical protein
VIRSLSRALGARHLGLSSAVLKMRGLSSQPCSAKLARPVLKDPGASYGGFNEAELAARS